MKTNYKNKVVVITGSRQGIGKELALQYSRAGAKVVLNARNAEKLEQTQKDFQKEGFDPLALAGDVSQWTFAEELMRKTYEKFGQIDIVITNAAIATRGKMEDLSPEIYQKLSDVNIMGSIYPAKAALPYLKRTKGAVLFISSIASFHGIPYNGIYCATKNAINSIAEASHVEFKPDGVFAGVCYVGFTENEKSKEILDTDGKVVTLAQRKNIKKQDRNAVANSIIRQIEKRQFRKTLSGTGQILNFLSRFSPRLLRLIYTLNLKKFEASAQ